MKAKQLLDRYTTYNRGLSRLLLFLTTAIILIALYPNYHSFRYDFQKGQPWVYADLKAPFDFSLTKTDKELQSEAILIVESCPIFLQEIERSSELNLKTKANWNAINDSLPILFERDLKSTLDRGVLSNFKALGKGERPIIIRKEEESQTVLLASLVDLSDYPKSIRQQLKAVNRDYFEMHSSALRTLFYANLMDDTLATRQLCDQRMTMLTPNEGKISKGEVLILNGALVDDLSFRKLETLAEAYSGGQEEETTRWKELLGVAMLTALLLLMLYLFLARFRTNVLNDFSSLSTLLLMWIIVTALARVSLEFGHEYLLLAPVPILPIVLRAFFDTRLALFVHILAILSIGLLSPEGLAMVFLHFIAGFYAIVSVDLLYKRAQLFVTLGKIVIVYVIVYTSLYLYRDTTLSEVPFMDYIFLGVNGLLTLAAFPMIYLIEKLTGMVSDVSLLELTDTNNPLLRELARKAPGTFQHSLQVSNLAEAAVLAIGGNPLLIRAGALYHDIGKMLNPLYFIENQSTGVNPHNELAFEESAQIIIQHVKDGIRLARSNNLPETLIDFIRTHHGSSTVQYFYRQHIKSFPAEEVDLQKFSYPGPKPFSMETAILMIADSAEAASRSLARKDANQIAELVDRIVDHQMTENQFSDAEITLSQINIAKETIKKKLQEIYHFRIAYPD